MAADTSILTAYSKERFPLPREVRFNRFAHSAVPTLMNGREDDFRIRKSGRHIYFLTVCFVCQQELLRSGWSGNTAWDTSTFVGWQQISLIIESKTLYDCKRLHAAKKECVGSQRILEYWRRNFDASREQISVLYVVWQIMYATHSDFMSHRYRF